MSAAPPLTDRQVADALGDVCDLRTLGEEQRAAVSAALRGAVPTSDRGERVFYVQIDTAQLRNVDTAECLWSTGPDFAVRGGRDEVLFSLRDDAACLEQNVLPLPALSDPAWLERHAVAWTGKRGAPRFGHWQKFWRRIGEPLTRFLLS